MCAHQCYQAEQSPDDLHFYYVVRVKHWLADQRRALSSPSHQPDAADSRLFCITRVPRCDADPTGRSPYSWKRSPHLRTRCRMTPDCLKTRRSRPPRKRTGCGLRNENDRHHHRCDPLPFHLPPHPKLRPMKRNQEFHLDCSTRRCCRPLKKNTGSKLRNDSGLRPPGSRLPLQLLAHGQWIGRLPLAVADRERGRSCR